MSITRRIERLEGPHAGHLTMVGLLAYGRAVRAGQPAAPLCACPHCRAMLADLLARVQGWRAGRAGRAGAEG